MSAFTTEEFNAILEISGTKIYDGYVLPITFENIREDIEQLEVFDDDVWVCGFPKSGNTWMQEMAWCIGNNLDFEAAKEPLELRFVYLEQSCTFNLSDVTNQSDILLKSVEVVRNMKRPRYIRTHLPWEMLPKQIQSFEKRPKIIHVIRNPMDTFVSLYYFTKLLGVYNGDIEMMVRPFLQNCVVFAPYVDHLTNYWNKSDQPNVLCVKYEDMKTNLSSVIDLVAELMGKTLSEGGKEELISHISFESMREKNIGPNIAIKVYHDQYPNYDKEGRFIRSGKTGGYRSELSEETIDLFKRHIVDKLEEAGMKFTV